MLNQVEKKEELNNGKKRRLKINSENNFSTYY
nr:MAG TPA: hypothetical protein [Caudoviricetes sp.]